MAARSNQVMDDISRFIFDKKGRLNFRRFDLFKKKFSDTYVEILEYNKPLPIKENLNQREIFRIKFFNWFYQYKKEDLICRLDGCDNIVPWTHHIPNNLCSDKCRIKDGYQIGINLKKSNLKKYGVTSTAKLGTTKAKFRQTMQDKYGVTSPMHVPEFKAKLKANNIAKYGVVHPMKLDSFKEKTRQTNIKKYGTDHYMQLKDSVEKFKREFKSKHGAESPMQVPEFKEKQKKVMLDKYGGYTWVSPVLSSRAKDTILKKYGIENYAQTDEFKRQTRETNLKKYGVPFYSRTDEFKHHMEENKEEYLKRARETNLKKYGTETASRKHYNLDNFKNLTKEVIENAFKKDEHLKVDKLQDFINCGRTTAYKIAHAHDVTWDHDTGGFNPNKPAVLYYLKDLETGLYKIGITNKSAEVRFGKDFCSKRVMILLEQTHKNGQDAYLAEQEILTAFGYYRTTNESWPEEKGGKTEFFKEDVLKMDIKNNKGIQ